jgi:hypothetical protein
MRHSGHVTIIRVLPDIFLMQTPQHGERFDPKEVIETP